MGDQQRKPAFLDFKAVGKDGKPSKDLPLKDGYFEMCLLKAFFGGTPGPSNRNG